MVSPENLPNSQKAGKETDIVDISGQNGEPLPFSERYALLLDQHPEIRFPLLAISQLEKKDPNLGLADEEKEALLVSELWSENPVAATRTAQALGIPERILNQYVDSALYELQPYADKVHDLSRQLRRRVPSSDTSFPPKPVIYQEPVLKALPAVQPTIVFPQPSEAKDAPYHGTLSQTHDHPTLTRDQEEFLFEALKDGTPLEMVIEDERFTNSVYPQELRQWGKVIAKSQTVEDLICNTSLNLVTAIARGYQSSTVSFTDRVNAGNIGLLRAVREHDPVKGRLSSYAVWGIRGAIQKEVREQKSAIRLPANVEQDVRKARSISDAFKFLFGKSPDTEELRKQLIANTDLTTSRIDTAIRVIRSNIQQIRSIHETPFAESEEELASFIPDKEVDVEAAVVQAVTDIEKVREIQRALRQHLSVEEQQVIKNLFGIGEVMEKPLEEVAWQMNRSIQDVLDMRQRSLAKLREDEGLQEQWEEDAPSFLYRMSAERAAIKLGLFRNLRATLAERAFEQGSKRTEVIIFNPEKVIEEATPPERLDAIIRVTAIEAPVDSPIVLEETGNKVDINHIATIDRVRDLRNQGLNNQQIAGMLDVSLSTVEVYASRLIRSGEIVPLRNRGKNDTGVVVLFPEGTQQGGRLRIVDRLPDFPTGNGVGEHKSPLIGSLARIKELREQGLDNQKIADITGLTYGSVRTYASTLIKRGELPIPGSLEANTSSDSTSERIKFLLSQGLSNGKIAEELDISPATVSRHITKLFKVGEITSLPAVEWVPAEKNPNSLIYKVKELRNQGYNNQQITEMLRVSYGSVAQSAIRLLKKGEITALRRSGYTVGSRQDSPNRLEQVKELRLQGLGNNEISERLGIAYATVNVYASKLIKAGEIPVFVRRDSPENTIGGNGHTNSTLVRVKELREQGLNNQQIAEVLDLTPGTIKTYVSTLLHRRELVQYWGVPGVNTRDGVKELKLQGLENQQIADQLNISINTVKAYTNKLIRDGELPAPVYPTWQSRAEQRAAAQSEETELVRKYLEEHPRPTYKDTFKRFFGRKPETLEFDAKIKELRQQGVVSYTEMADRLETTPRRVERSMQRLIKAKEVEPVPFAERNWAHVNITKNPRPETIAFQAQVKELREQGLTHPQIAEKLNSNVLLVQAAAYRLIHTGQLNPRRAVSSESVLKRAEYNKTQERIKELVGQGLNVIQIAESLDDSLSHVSIIVWRLTKKGEITPTPEQVRPANLTGYVDKKASVPAGILSKVYEKVTELRNQGISNGEIAKELNLPVHRIEVYASFLIRAGVIQPAIGNRSQKVGVVDPNFELPKCKYYDKVAELRNQGLNNQQIAEQLHKSPASVASMASKLIRAGIIKPRRNITTDDKNILISRVTKLRNQGFGNTEIAEALTQSIIRINNIARGLVKSGQVQAIKRKGIRRKKGKLKVIGHLADFPS